MKRKATRKKIEDWSIAMRVPKIEKCGSLPSENSRSFQSQTLFNAFLFLTARHKTHKILITNFCSAIVGVARCFASPHASRSHLRYIGQYTKPPTCLCMWWWNKNICSCIQYARRWCFHVLVSELRNFLLCLSKTIITSEEHNQAHMMKLF